MAANIKAAQNQSMADVIIQGCGTLEAGMQMMLSNGNSISDYPDVGDQFILPTPAANPDVLRYFAQNDVVIGTLDTNASVVVTEVLKPVMKAVPRTSSLPSSTGDYEFDLKEATGFINIYSIPHANYPSNPMPPLNYITEERYIAGLAPDINLGIDLGGSGVPYMDDKKISYRMTWVTGRGFMLAWSSMGGTKTVTFQDINGNTAYTSPLIVLDNTTQTVVEYLIANIKVEVVSATHNTATIRLTRTHPPVAHIDFAAHTMSWLADASGGSPDPSDPGNADKTILVLTRGNYTFGVGTIYLNGTATYPASACTEVVEIR